MTDPSPQSSPLPSPEPSPESATPAPRTFAEIQKLILGMPFVRALQIAIVDARPEAGMVMMPLSDVSTYDGNAFAAVALGAVCDVAAGVAALATIPANRMPATTKVDLDISTPPAGSLLAANAVLHERTGDTLVFKAYPLVQQDGDKPGFQCGEATITLRLVDV